MYLTTKMTTGLSQPTMLHEEVEFMFEYYSKQLEDIQAQVAELLSNIRYVRCRVAPRRRQEDAPRSNGGIALPPPPAAELNRTTQSVVNITLDAQRNSLLLLELRLTMGSVLRCSRPRPRGARPPLA